MRKINIIYLFFFLLSFFFILIWFKDGNMLATGEEGIPLYNSTRTLSVYRYPWYETGTGYPMAVVLPRVTFLAFVSWTEDFLQPQIVQAIIFIFIISSGLIGIFLLVNLLADDIGVAVISSLFYLFNIYTVTQVVGRFIYPGIFVWSYLPWFLYLWIRQINEPSLKRVFLFCIAAVIFSDAFGQPANILAIWIPAFLFVVLELVRSKDHKRRWVLVIINGLFLFILWVLINWWWLYPFLILGRISFSEISDWRANFDSLRGVSQYFSTDQILLLRQSFLLGKGSVFYWFYSQVWVSLLTYVVLVITILGLLKSRKERYWGFLIVVAITGWFISKGSNPPFGYEFFKFLFSMFPFTAILRNPYEKFGIVWLFPYSVFFSYGVLWLYKRIKWRFGKLFIIATLILSCVILVWPMWTGDIFPKSLRVKIPFSYQMANQFINQDQSDGRILILPIIPGDSVKYAWGYQGVEPSEFLFDRPAVSKVLRAEHFDEKYWSLVKSFVKEGDYNKLLDEMNIKYLVLHNDLISDASGASYSAQVRQTIAKNPQINFLKSFGDLEVYEYVGSLNPGLFVMTGKKSNLLSYQRLNSTHYIVNVQNAKEPYKLVFRETYNDLWEARINGKKIDRHFTIYDYANAWEIDQNGDYTVDVIFKVWPWE